MASADGRINRLATEVDYRAPYLSGEVDEQLDGDPMSSSESKSGVKSSLRRGGDSSQMDLSMLRAQFTSTPSPSLDQTLMQSSRFREEEKLRAKLRRESKLRREALSERISLMQDNMAIDT